ncbi:MAG: SpoIIE family protein phosphatase [Chlamydiales bacterium]|nr:SpoIIE family protein phosphatase [Chlamydiales bacterium]
MITEANLSQALDTTRQAPKIKVLLVDDQRLVIEGVRNMLADAPDVNFFFCQDPSKAIQMAEEIQPTVILQDLVMPEIDGLLLVRYFRANPKTRDVPMIVLSAQEEPKIKAQAFALGANDYMVKLPDKVELLARIRYHSQSYIRLLERNEAFARLEASQTVLKRELADAAEYVRSLLPEPITDNVLSADWKFIPSALLGGDCFGYHWLDADHFAIYLLDVCGHGVGAALLSISVANILRTQALVNTDFHDPSQVLEALNEAFQMEQHRNMFFTMWYGVYNKRTRRLNYASGGHPPAVLLTGDTADTAKTVLLKTPGLVVGGMPNTQFIADEVSVGPYNKLFVFSDGVYELAGEDGMILQLDDLVEVMIKPLPSDSDDIARVLAFAKNVSATDLFPDDFSVVKIVFK